VWLGAEADGLDTALITAVWAFLGIVVTTLGTIGVASMRARKDTTSASPVPVSEGGSLVEIARNQGKLIQRADDADEALHLQEKRLDRLERWAEHHDPDWWQR
jgi:hypothetical protein